MLGTEDCVSEQVGGPRRRSAAATPTSASSEGHHSTQNALIKSLLNKLRLSGSKLKHEKFEKFNFAIPPTGTLDTPLNQGKQLDQRHGRHSTGVSPFELARVLPPSQRPSPTAHTPTTSAPLDPAASATDPASVGPLASGGGSLSFHASQPSQAHQPINAQRSLEAALNGQQSWGSPRSEALRPSEPGAAAAAAAAESARLAAITQLPLPGGLGLSSLSPSLGGAGGSSGGGGTSARRPSRPSIVPPLDLNRLGSKDGRRTSKQGLNSPIGSAPPSAGGQAAAAHPPLAPAPPLTPHQYQQQLAESLADLDEELEGWAAPARWNPSHQGRWYLYPPIGRKEVSPVEQLVESLSPSQAAAVVLLWRQYAAARYSAELMAGRAVRLCRELGHELNECRGEVEERTQRHADHAAQLGKAIMRLQQQLEEARRTAAAATLAAAQAAAQAQASSQQTLNGSETPPTGSSFDPNQPHHQHHLRLQLSQSLPGAPAHVSHLGSSPARRASAGAGAAAAASPAMSREGSVRGSASVAGGVLAQILARDKERERELRLMSAGRSVAGAATGAGAGDGGGASLAAENDDLAVQLEQMRSLFLEAHEDSRALREALIEVDEQNMQLYEQSSGLRRHASAVLKENDTLRQEVAQLRAVLAVSGGGGGASGGRQQQLLSSAAATVELLLPSTAPGGGKASGKGYGSMKSAGSGFGFDTGQRTASEHVVIAAASPQPPRRPPAGSSSAAAGAMTPTSGKTGQQIDTRTSARRASGAMPPGEVGGMSGAAAPPLPLPPGRPSARPIVSQRGPVTTSGGRSAKEQLPVPPAASYVLPTDAGASGRLASAAAAVANTMSERNSGRTVLSEALATDGAVVVVHASRRAPPAGQGAAGGVTSSSAGSGPVVQLRPGSAAAAGLGLGHTLPTHLGSAAQPLAGTVGKAVGSTGGGTSDGGGSSSGGGVRLQSSVEERLLKAQAAVAQARAAMAAAMSSQQQF